LFLKKKGTAVGIVVAGLGLGTLVYSPLARVPHWDVELAICIRSVWIHDLAVYCWRPISSEENPQDLGLRPYGQEPQGSTPEDAKGTQGTAYSASAPQTIYTKEALAKPYFWILFFVHVVGGSMAIHWYNLVPYANGYRVSLIRRQPCWCFGGVKASWGVWRWSA